MEIKDITSMLKSNKVSLTGDDVVELTPKGKDNADTNAYGDVRAKVLYSLDKNGSTTIRELASDTRLDISTVKNAVEYLITKKRYVSKVGF